MGKSVVISSDEKMAGPIHESVLLRESIDFLAPQDGGVYVDLTLGRGGHTQEILRRCAPSGRLLAFDRDPDAVLESRERLVAFKDRLEVIHDDFSRLPMYLRERGIEAVDGMVADLGVSSPQLDRANRGFSFLREGPLDMRMDTSTGMTALELIASTRESDLADVIFRYGEERKSRRIARRVKEACAAGELVTTLDLARVVERAVGRGTNGRAAGGKGSSGRGSKGSGRNSRGRSRIHPATRTFQALRIAVNDELGLLEAMLDACAGCLRPGGVIAVISFHSLEDRIVKHRFRDHDDLQVLTKKPLRASEEESANNPRSRSAKLRAARKCNQAKDTGTQLDSSPDARGPSSANRSWKRREGSR